MKTFPMSIPLLGVSVLAWELALVAGCMLFTRLFVFRAIKAWRKTAIEKALTWLLAAGFTVVLSVFLSIFLSPSANSLQQEKDRIKSRLRMSQMKQKVYEKGIGPRAPEVIRQEAQKAYREEISKMVNEETELAKTLALMQESEPTQIFGVMEFPEVDPKNRTRI
jgi:hypothetical protein